MKKNIKRKKRIKIAYFIDSINSIAGTEKQLIQMIEYLDKKNFDAQMICLRKPSALFENYNNKFKYLELGIKSLISLYGLFKLLWLIYYLRKEKIDIVQTYFFDATIVGVIAGNLAGVKSIISCRRDMGFWHTPLLVRILKIINRMTTRVMVNSNAVKQYTSECEKISEIKIDVIKNGIHLKQFTGSFSKGSFRKIYNIPDEDSIIGIVANLNRQVKRVDVFINMASEVLKKNSNVSFFIVGDGHLRGDLERLAKQLNLFEKIHFLGRRTDIYWIIKNWDLGVISSDSEGLSNSVLEYMAAGVPVVGTNTGGNGEVIIEEVNGFLVEPGDYHSMAEKTCNLLKNKTKRSQMSENAEKMILNEYSWEKKILEIESYYKNLMN